MNEICIMQILVLAATAMEIAPFLKSGETADHLITGVGVPASIYKLSKALHNKEYDFVIQAGIGGTFDPLIPLGETVLIQKDCFADLGIFENGQLGSVFSHGFANPNEFPFQDGWLVNPSALLETISLPKRSAISVNMVTADAGMIGEYKRLYNAEVESMEGAALHYTCLMEEIPFLQLRSISNQVGERDKRKWDIAAAVRNLNNHLIDIVRLLKERV